MFRANVSLKWTNNQDFTYDTGHNAMVYCYSSMKIERIWYFLSPFLLLYFFITSMWRFLEFTFLYFPLLINRITQYEVSVYSIFSNLTIESMLPWWTIETGSKMVTICNTIHFRNCVYLMAPLNLCSNNKIEFLSCEHLPFEN